MAGFNLDEVRRVGKDEELPQTNPSSPQQATLSTADPGFDLPNARRVESDDTSGAGEMAGALVASVPEMVGRGPKTALRLADQLMKVPGKLGMKPRSLPGPIQKFLQHGEAESLIGAGAAIGNELERAAIKRSQGKPALSDQIMHDAGETFKQSLGFGGIIRGAGGVFNKITYRPQVFQSPEVNLAFKVFNEAMERRGFSPLTLDAATNSTVLDVFGNVARSGMGGGKMVKFEEAAIEAANEMFEIMQKHVGEATNPDDLGRLLFEMIIHKDEVVKAPLALARNGLVHEAMGGELAVNADPVLNLIQRNKAEIDAIGGFGKSESGVTMAESLLNMTERPTLANMVKIKEMAGAAKRRLKADDTMKGTPASGLMEQIEFQADESIRLALKGYDKLTGRKGATSLAKGWEENQTRFVKEYYEVFYNNSMATIKQKIGDGPGAIPADVMSLLVKKETKGSLQYVQAMKDAVSDPGLWNKTGRGFVDALRLESRDPETKRFSGKKLFALLTNPKDSKKAIGDRTLDTMLGEKLHNDLLEFSRALMVQQAKNPTAAGNVATTLAQGGAVIGAGATAAEGQVSKSVKILAMIPAVPWLFARLMTNRTFVKLATKGLRATPGSPAELAIYARLANLISVANLREKHEAGPPEQQTTTRTAPRRSDATRGPAFVR